MVIGDLRPGAGEHRKDGALAHIGQAHQAHIGNGQQFQLHLVLQRFLPGLGKAGALAGGRSKAGIALAASAAVQHDAALFALVQVRHDAARFHIPHQRAHRYADNEVFAVFSA